LDRRRLRAGGVRMDQHEPLGRSGLPADRPHVHGSDDHGPVSPRLTGWLAALTLALAACAQPGAEAEREAVTLAAREQAAGGTADAGSAAPGEVAAAGDEGADASPRRKAR